MRSYKVVYCLSNTNFDAFCVFSRYVGKLELISKIIFETKSLKVCLSKVGYVLTILSDNLTRTSVRPPHGYNGLWSKNPLI